MAEMIELEEEELMKNEQDIETAAYKEAFDHFDWNHSGRIPTSVRLFQLWLACHLLISNQVGKVDFLFDALIKKLIPLT